MPLFLVGFVSILGQVVLLRELNVAFYGVELIYILAMGVWLLWTAAGAVLGRRGFSPSPAGVRRLFLVLAALPPAEIAFCRSLGFLFGGITGAYLPFGLQILGILLVLTPMGILLGLAFQWTARIHIQNGGGLAGAYAVESAGGVTGGLAATLLLQWGLRNFTIAILCCLATAGALLTSRAGTRDRTRVFAMLMFLMLIGLWVRAPEIDRGMTRWNHPFLIAVRDSPYGRIAISGRSNQYAVYENNALGFETESPAAEEFVHLAALQSAAPRRVLAAGGGMEGILDEAMKHHPDHIDYVEINRVLLDMVEKYLPERFTRSLRAENVSVFVTDPRRFLKNAPLYDLILVGMPEPASGAANRFYTQEFFGLCADHLPPDGILAFRLPASENLWTPLLRHRNAGIYLALRSAFEDVLVLPGVSAAFIASRSPLIRDPETLARRFAKRNIEARLVSPEYLRYLFTNDRFSEIANLLAETRTVPNTDDHPVSYRYSSMIWLSRLIPSMIHRQPSVPEREGRWMLIWGIGFTVVFFCLAIRKQPRLRRFCLVFLAGFAGMVLETMLLLHYQSKVGALFQNIGVLLTMFMAGLAIGSAATGRLGGIDKARFGRVRRGLGMYLLLGFTALNVVFLNRWDGNQTSGIVSVSILLFLNGCLVSGLFAYASLAGVDSQQRVVSPLYAADLLGGCLGSVLGSLWLIPFWGMGSTAWLMALLSAAAAPLL